MTTRARIGHPRVTRLCEDVTTRQARPGKTTTAQQAHYNANLLVNALPVVGAAEIGDMRSVVLAVPDVEEEHPVKSADAVIGMAEGACEVGVVERAKQARPAIVEIVEKGQRDFDGSGLSVGEIGPARFLVRLDGGLGF